MAKIKGIAVKEFDRIYKAQKTFSISSDLLNRLRAMPGRNQSAFVEDSLRAAFARLDDSKKRKRPAKKPLENPVTVTQ